ncbi:hypothetical protein PAPYR_11141 [Paratrimastix pyriformis]|uniref:Uncharacterized protein n=1 Tax=Paratrimastix pyriformis TaxID=342808 RepID=A0ABQ8U4E8_9EUKA|nr:hypothetical protein PAPYR_11141 [Paratrimastix pyriformis]
MGLLWGSVSTILREMYPELRRLPQRPAPLSANMSFASPIITAPSSAPRQLSIVPPRFVVYPGITSVFSASSPKSSSSASATPPSGSTPTTTTTTPTTPASPGTASHRHHRPPSTHFRARRPHGYQPSRFLRQFQQQQQQHAAPPLSPPFGASPVGGPTPPPLPTASASEDKGAGSSTGDALASSPHTPISTSPPAGSPPPPLPTPLAAASKLLSLSTTALVPVTTTITTITGGVGDPDAPTSSLSAALAAEKVGVLVAFSPHDGPVPWAAPGPGPAPSTRAAPPPPNRRGGRHPGAP